MFEKRAQTHFTGFAKYETVENRMSKIKYRLFLFWIK